MPRSSAACVNASIAASRCSSVSAAPSGSGCGPARAARPGTRTGTYTQLHQALRHRHGDVASPNMTGRSGALLGELKPAAVIAERKRSAWRIGGHDGRRWRQLRIASRAPRRGRECVREEVGATVGGAGRRWVGGLTKPPIAPPRPCRACSSRCRPDRRPRVTGFPRPPVRSNRWRGSHRPCQGIECVCEFTDRPGREVAVHENTPSVTIRIAPSPSARAASSCVRRSAMSRVAKRYRLAFDSRTPSMITHGSVSR